MVSPARYQKDFYGWKSVPFAIFAYIPYLVFLSVRFAIGRSKLLLDFARKKGNCSYFAAWSLVLVFFATPILGIGFSVHSVIANLDRNQQIKATADAHSKMRFGKCNGFGLELQNRIPEGAIAAAKTLLRGLNPIDLGNYSLVDVVAETTFPHLCRGELYSGKIPPGANTAYLIQFSHDKSELELERSIEGLITSLKSKPHTKTRVLVANYPEIGWQALYSDSALNEGFFK